MPHGSSPLDVYPYGNVLWCHDSGLHHRRRLQRSGRRHPAADPRHPRRRRRTGRRTRGHPGAHPAAGVEAPPRAAGGRAGGGPRHRAPPGLLLAPRSPTTARYVAGRAHPAGERPPRPPRRLPARVAGGGGPLMTIRPGSATVELPSPTEILITRVFEAPRRLVWEAVTTPRHLLRWWGPSWSPLVRCDVDLRPGGAWRYVSRNADGTELAWYGEYREI